MATEIFKDGESILVQPKHLQAHIQNGWSFEDKKFEPKTETKALKKSKKKSKED